MFVVIAFSGTHGYNLHLQNINTGTYKCVEIFVLSTSTIWNIHIVWLFPHPILQGYTKILTTTRLSDEHSLTC